MLYLIHAQHLVQIELTHTMMTQKAFYLFTKFGELKSIQS